jgi:endonuclease YncB( thermonuclease family)
MAFTKFKPSRKAPSFKPRRSEVRKAAWSVPLLLAAGALLDPKLIGPVGPLAAPYELVTANFSLCGPGSAPTCVIDGETFRLGDRTIRITGIDAPDLAAPKCPAEGALAKRSAERLVQLLNAGTFEMVAHRLQMQDRHGKRLMVILRNDDSIGARMIDEGLAHRYMGLKTGWC